MLCTSSHTSHSSEKVKSSGKAKFPIPVRLDMYLHLTEA